MNKDLLVKGLIFAAGAIIGSVVTRKVVKTKYEQIANEEIESVKKIFAQNKVDEVSEEKRTVEKLKDMVQELGYKNEQIMKERELERENNKKEEDDFMNYKPEVIPPEESWEQDYPMLTLTYYEGDGVLTDDRDRMIDNVDELVGDDFASHFGEYEDDAVYIRNEKLKVYYEILRDSGSYSDLEDN